MSVQRAKADLANLESQVQQYRAKMQEAELRASKLRTYIEVSQEYDHRSKDAGYDLAPVAHENPNPVNQKATGERGITSAAVETSIELLERNGSPIHTRDLLRMLADRDIRIGGANPVANLSGFLSREKGRLSNSRTNGWSLRRWQTAHANSADSTQSQTEHGVNDGDESTNGDQRVA